MRHAASGGDYVLMWLNVLECLAMLAAALLASVLLSPKASRTLAAWLLAQACVTEYLYAEMKALTRRAIYLRNGELEFYREQLELERKRDFA